MIFLEILKQKPFNLTCFEYRSNAKLNFAWRYCYNLSKLGFEYRSAKVWALIEVKRAKLAGRYIDKRVDVTITKNKNRFFGIAVKFMSNYSEF